jgi:hypothetical protein
MKADGSRQRIAAAALSADADWFQSKALQHGSFGK